MATISNWYMKAIGVRHKVRIITQTLVAYPYRIRVHFRSDSQEPQKTMTLELSAEETLSLIQKLEHEIDMLHKRK